MNDDAQKNKPVLLMILDGFGVAPASGGNAISLAQKPFFDKLVNNYFSTTLQASGLAVGLPWGEAGNSEVGHLNLGAGKIIYQTLPRINKEIGDRTFFSNKKFLAAIDHAKKNQSKLHLMGLVSSGGVHSSLEHLFALLDLCQKNKFKNVFIHAFLDGRDAPLDSGQKFIQDLEKKIKEIGFGKIASLAGRYYAMDRDNHWERTEKSYQVMIGQGQLVSNPFEAIENSYQQKIYDEEFNPIIISENEKPVAVVEDKDALIFFNFRPDRARQITKAFVLEKFDKFNRLKKIEDLFFVAMSEYEEGLPVEVAFLPEKIENSLAKIIAEQGLKQLHIAETEKYAHVTYFFNGGKEKPHLNEDWVLVASPRISSYDQKPEMSAKELTEKIIVAVNSDKYDFIVVNFANPDMVGHTGKIEATIKAIEFLDKMIEQITEAILNKNGVMIIVADHGNAEDLLNLRKGGIDKEHSNNPVPFILVGHQWQQSIEQRIDLVMMPPAGVLADIAPTILKLMEISQPKEMNGNSLI